MNVIVVGAGEIGLHVAERLSNEGHDVTLIEKGRSKEQHLKARLNALIVHGSGASTDTLEQAGIEHADLFISVTDQDEVNLVACLLAHEAKVPRVIARIKSLEYTTSEWAHNAYKLGIDLLINPQSVVADEICRVVSYTSAAQAAEFAGGRVVFLGYQMGRHSPLAGITLKELGGIRGMYPMVVTAITRRYETIIPRGEDAIQEGDIVFFVCNKSDLPAINYLFESEGPPTKTIFILGGDAIGTTLARRLAALHYQVKIIDDDPERCEKLAQELDNVVVLNTEGTDVATLKDEGIERCDVFLAVTHNEQANILCALLGKSYGARRAIALVDRHEFVTLAPSLGVDACVSPRLATANAILKYVRPSTVATLTTVEQNNAEVLEIALPSDNPNLNRPLRDIDVPTGAIIAVVVRGEQVIIPGGDDHLQAGDHVIVFVLPEAVARVEQFFS